MVKKKDYVIKSTRKSFRVSKLKDKHIIYYGKRAEDDCLNDYISETERGIAEGLKRP